MLNKETLISQYKYFFKKVFNEIPEIKKRDESYINTFLNLLDELYGLDNIGEDFLFNYLIFQFDKYSTADINMKVQLNWIYGKQAIEKWQSKTENYDYFGSLFRQRFNIRYKHGFSRPESVSVVYKDRERRRFSDVKRQLLHCIELSLYSEDSEVCKGCEMYEICEK